MFNNEEQIRLANLLFKYLKGQCTEEEIEHIEEWLKDSHNRSLFENIKKSYFKEFDKKYNQDISEYQNKFIERIDKKSKYINFKQSAFKYLKYAALVILIVGTVFTIKEISQTNSKEPLISEIAPLDTNCVIIHTGSGDKIVLNKEILKDSVIKHKSSHFNISHNSISYKENVDIKDVVYNTVEVPYNGEFFIKLGDNTKVWMNANSKLKYPIKFIGKQRKVWLEGEAYMQVTHDNEHPFIVDMNGSEIEVLGTEFNARNYKGENPTTTLVKGKVKVRKGLQNTILTPGQQAIVLDNKIEKKNVKILNYIAWKDGYFVYEHQPLDHILKQLSSWYGFNYFYQNKVLAKRIFSAKIKKYKNLTNTLDIISSTGDVKFRIKNNTVIVCYK